MKGIPEIAPVPRSLRYMSWIALAVGISMIFAGGWLVGVTWDEPLHVQRLNHYLQTGWFLGDGQLIDGRPAPDMTQQYVYAPVTMLFLHGLGLLFATDGHGAASATSDAYLVRHLGIGLISLLGILAVGLTARVLFRRWDWALVSVGLLAVLPMWVGHSMFNVKDVPVATGYSITTLGLVILARNDRGTDRRLRWGGPIAIAVGTFLAVGTRPGMWTGLFASACVLVLGLMVQSNADNLTVRIRADLWRYRDLVLSVVVAYVGLLIVDPKVFGSPIHALIESASSSADFTGSEAPWTFVPVKVLLAVPFLMLGFVAFGVTEHTRRLFAVRLRIESTDLGLLIVLAQVFALPLVAIVHGATLYGDLRQLLFSAPATMLVATFGIQRLVTRAAAGPDRRGPPMVAAISCAAILAPMLDQLTLYPYNYAYYNPLATIAQAPVDGDYYRASGRELVSRIPDQGRIVCSPEADDNQLAMRMAHLDGWTDCATTLSSPIAAYADKRQGDDVPLAPDEFLIVTFSSRGSVADNCRIISSTTRRVGLRTLHLASLGICHRDFPIMGTRLHSMTFGRIKDLDLPDLGWFIPGTDGRANGIVSRGEASTMTFRLADEFAGHDVRLIVSTEYHGGVVARFGSTPVPVAPLAGDPTTLCLTIPSALVHDALDVARSLEFRSSNSAPLKMKLTAIRAEIVDES